MRRARNKNRKVVLCSRDMHIMSSLFEGKIASQEQIGDHLFPGVSAQTVNRRLLKIIELGFIRRKPIAIDDKIIYAYSLTQRGLIKIKPMLPYRVTTKTALSECPAHDIALNDIRKAFEEKGAVQNYYTENVLQACVGFKSDKQFRPFVELNSDAMAEVNTRIGVLNLAIEFDTAHKSKDRYRQKVNSYYIKRGVDGVLYVCASKHIMDVLHEVDKGVADRHKCKHKLYFALLENVTGGIDELTFTNAKGGIFVVG